MSKSRPQRWSEAVRGAMKGIETLQTNVELLKELQEEYQDWLDGLPENLQSGETAEKLQEIIDMDFDSVDDGLGIIEEAEVAELPAGFGRD